MELSTKWRYLEISRYLSRLILSAMGAEVGVSLPVIFNGGLGVQSHEHSEPHEGLNVLSRHGCPLVEFYWPHDFPGIQVRLVNNILDQLRCKKQPEDIHWPFWDGNCWAYWRWWYKGVDSGSGKIGSLIRFHI